MMLAAIWNGTRFRCGWLRASFRTGCRTAVRAHIGACSIASDLAATRHVARSVLSPGTPGLRRNYRSALGNRLPEVSGLHTTTPSKKSSRRVGAGPKERTVDELGSFVFRLYGWTRLHVVSKRSMVRRQRLCSKSDSGHEDTAGGALTKNISLEPRRPHTSSSTVPSTCSMQPTGF